MKQALINYIKGKQNYFNTSWFIHGLNNFKGLHFVEVKDE